MFKKGQIYRIKSSWSSVVRVNTLVLIFDDLPQKFAQHHRHCNSKIICDSFPCVPTLFLHDRIISFVHWGSNQAFINKHLELLTNEQEIKY